MRAPTSANSGLPPTRWTVRSKRLAAGPVGAGGAGGTVGGGAVGGGAVGGGRVAAGAAVGDAAMHRSADVAPTQSRASSDASRRTPFIARSYAAGPTTDV